MLNLLHNLLCLTGSARGAARDRPLMFPQSEFEAGVQCWCMYCNLIYSLMQFNACDRASDSKKRARRHRVSSPQPKISCHKQFCKQFAAQPTPQPETQQPIESTPPSTVSVCGKKWVLLATTTTLCPTRQDTDTLLRRGCKNTSTELLGMMQKAVDVVKHFGTKVKVEFPRYRWLTCLQYFQLKSYSKVSLVTLISIYMYIYYLPAEEIQQG